MDNPFAPRTCAVCCRPVLSTDETATVGQVAVHLACYPPRQRAQSRAGRGHPVCPLCQIPIVAGDHVIYGTEALLHAECHDRARAGDALATFLGAHAGQAFCRTCLAARLVLSWDRVRKTMWALASTPRFTVGAETCSACGTARATIVALRPPTVRALDAS
jgi:hypothetical protein